MNARAERAVPTHAFIAPDLNGPPTGGTLYNAQLITALRAQGVNCEHVSLANAAAALADSAAQCVWVDSLYLDALPALRAHSGARRVCLIAHYLPSLVSHARELEWNDLSENEQAAIAAADGFLVTSAFMREQLRRFPLGERSVFCVEPGSEVRPQPRVLSAQARAAAHGLMLCNVVEAKGVLALLQALAQAARASDGFRLQIAGRIDLEAQYAHTCQQLVATTRALRERVTLYGALPHADALVQLQRCDVFLSASRMESYGMALAEARAAGIPIVARKGGHTQALVTTEAGGVLVADETAVSAGFLELARNRALLTERQNAAILHARSRTWSEAATEFLSQLK